MSQTRWLVISCSPPVFVEEALGGAGRDEPGKTRVADPPFGGWGHQQTPPLELGEPRGWIAPLGWRGGYQLGDHLSTIGDLDVLARARQAHVFAEAIL